MSTITEAVPAAAEHLAEIRGNVTGRFGPRWLNQAKALVGLPPQRRLAYAALQIDRVRHWEKEFSRLSDAEVKQTGLKLRGRARGGEPLDKILPEVFGLVCVAAHRQVGLRPFDVQLRDVAQPRRGPIRRGPATTLRATPRPTSPARPAGGAGRSA